MSKNLNKATVEELEEELERRKAEAAKASPYRTAIAPPPPPPMPTSLVHPSAEGFKEKCTPKKPDENMFFFKCSCGGIHYRHAGYTEIFIPFLKSGGAKEVVNEQRCVMVCVACRKSYIWAGEQMYDVTDQIDLKAWEKSEKELHAATGPGGQSCPPLASASS